VHLIEAAGLPFIMSFCVWLVQDLGPTRANNYHPTNIQESFDGNLNEDYVM